MQEEKRIELTLGQESGEFRLVVNGIAIAINLKGHSSPSGVASPQALLPDQKEMGSPETPKGEVLQLSAELDHYRQVSREIYEGLGKLAKDINLSIQDLNIEEIVKSTTASPGDHLNQARTQVADVLQMTEQATLNIMDLVEEIREDCQTVQKQLKALADGSSLETEKDAASQAPASEEYQEQWAELLEQAEDLDQLLLAPEAPAPEPRPQSVHIPLGDVLQIILEFCANETVKQHLKAVQAKQEAIFRVAEAERALALLAADVPQEEGFYQLPVDALLNLLKSHCEDDRVKELFTKMAASVGKLFPISALPLEGQKVDGDTMVEIPPGPALAPEVVEKWEDFHQKLKHLAQTSASFPAGGNGTASGQGIGDTVQEILVSVDRISGRLSRIIEALSFQDLSGQRLLKILNLLRQVQVQVLTLLVLAGQRFQWGVDGELILPQKQAREELDRLLQHNVPPSTNGSSAGAKEQPLDQDAINEILTSMGF